jgi:hypothetical protein
MSESPPKKDKARSSSIILDLSIKNALEAKAAINKNHDVILPWWFKRKVSVNWSKEKMDAWQWVMRWLQENAPEEAENVYCEADDTQNIVINPMFILQPEIQKAFIDAGFRVMTEDDMPEQEKTDVWERILKGSNFNEDKTWH